MKKYIIFLFLFIIACNKEYPIKPKFIDAGDWNTDIQLSNNNYNRIEIKIDSMPPREFQRDIINFSIEVKSDDNEFQQISTIPTLTGFWHNDYVTGSYFEEGKSYDVRVHWDFNEGEDKNSNTISFIAKEYNGEILEEFTLSNVPTYWSLEFSNNEIIYFSGDFTVSYNTTTRNHHMEELPETLKNHSRLFKYQDLFISYNYYHRDLLNFYYFNDGSTVLDSSVSESFYDCLDTHNYYQLQDIIKHQDEIYLLMQLENGDFQLLHFDPYSRNIIKTYPTFDPNEIFGTENIFFCSDGNDFWVAKLQHRFNNTILKFDIETNTILSDEYTIPVFYATGLAWDGNNFWTMSSAEQKFVKFKIEE